MSKKKLLPKRMAGIKIPKQIRRGAVGDFLASDAGQKMLAEGLLMVGAAVLGRETASGSAARRGAKAVAQGAEQAAGAATDATAATLQGGPARMGQAFNAAMRAFREALQPEAEPDFASEDQAVLGAEPASAKKNIRSSSAEFGTAH